MKKFSINEDLQGDKLKDLLLFVTGISDKMSLARYYKGKLTQEQFNQIQKEYKAFIHEEDKSRRLYYKENIDGFRDVVNSYYNGETEVEEYFYVLLEQDLECYNSLNYKNFNENSEPYELYYGKTDDFLYSRLTRNTPVTMGSVFEMSYYELGDTVRKLISSMPNLFQYSHYIENTRFEDLTFYNGERVVLAICPHENFANMNLEDEEYEEFSKLCILQDIIE